MKIAKNEYNPLVSIIVPSYNHGKYIRESIESIVSQTYQNFELIVIDDGSKDNSKEILNELQLKYNFKLVFQENHGVAYTLNRGFREFSSGKYITFCASDDFWLSTKIETQVKFLESNLFYPMCFGKTHYVDLDSNLNTSFDKLNLTLRSGWLFEDIFLSNIHPPVNYMFRKEIFEEVGYYDEGLAAEDYDMNLRIANKYAIGYIDSYLGFYRIDNSANKVANFERISLSHLNSIEKHKENKLYNKAKSTVYLRRFDLFSGYTILKKKAIVNLFRSASLIFNKRFIISMIKMVIYWK